MPSYVEVFATTSDMRFGNYAILKSTAEPTVHLIKKTYAFPDAATFNITLQRLEHRAMLRPINLLTIVQISPDVESLTIRLFLEFPPTTFDIKTLHKPAFLQFCEEILSGLATLESLGLSHGNLRPEFFTWIQAGQLFKLIENYVEQLPPWEVQRQLVQHRQQLFLSPDYFENLAKNVQNFGYNAQKNDIFSFGLILLRHFVEPEEVQKLFNFEESRFDYEHFEQLLRSCKEWVKDPAYDNVLGFIWNNMLRVDEKERKSPTQAYEEFKVLRAKLEGRVLRQNPADQALLPEVLAMLGGRNKSEWKFYDPFEFVDPLKVTEKLFEKQPGIEKLAIKFADDEFLEVDMGPKRSIAGPSVDLEKFLFTQAEHIQELRYTMGREGEPAQETVHGGNSETKGAVSQDSETLALKNDMLEELQLDITIPLNEASLIDGQHDTEENIEADQENSLNYLKSSGFHLGQALENEKEDSKAIIQKAPNLLFLEANLNVTQSDKGADESGHNLKLSDFLNNLKRKKQPADSKIPLIENDSNHAIDKQYSATTESQVLGGHYQVDVLSEPISPNKNPEQPPVSTKTTSTEVQTQNNVLIPAEDDFFRIEKRQSLPKDDFFHFDHKLLLNQKQAQQKNAIFDTDGTNTPITPPARANVTQPSENVKKQTSAFNIISQYVNRPASIDNRLSPVDNHVASSVQEHGMVMQGRASHHSNSQAFHTSGQYSASAHGSSLNTGGAPIKRAMHKQPSRNNIGLYTYQAFGYKSPQMKQTIPRRPRLISSHMSSHLQSCEKQANHHLESSKHVSGNKMNVLLPELSNLTSANQNDHQSASEAITLRCEEGDSATYQSPGLEHFCFGSETVLAKSPVDNSSEAIKKDFGNKSSLPDVLMHQTTQNSGKTEKNKDPLGGKSASKEMWAMKQASFKKVKRAIVQPRFSNMRGRNIDNRKDSRNVSTHKADQSFSNKNDSFEAKLGVVSRTFAPKKQELLTAEPGQHKFEQTELISTQNNRQKDCVLTVEQKVVDLLAKVSKTQPQTWKAKLPVRSSQNFTSVTTKGAIYKTRDNRTQRSPNATKDTQAVNFEAIRDKTSEFVSPVCNRSPDVSPLKQELKVTALQTNEKGLNRQFDRSPSTNFTGKKLVGSSHNLWTQHKQRTLESKKRLELSCGFNKDSKPAYLKNASNYQSSALSSTGFHNPQTSVAKQNFNAYNRRQSHSISHQGKSTSLKQSEREPTKGLENTNKISNLILNIYCDGFKTAHSNMPPKPVNHTTSVSFEYAHDQAKFAHPKPSHDYMAASLTDSEHGIRSQQQIRRATEGGNAHGKAAIKTDIKSTVLNFINATRK